MANNSSKIEQLEREINRLKHENTELKNQLGVSANLSADQSNPQEIDTPSYKSVMQSSPCGIVVHDKFGSSIHANIKAETIDLDQVESYTKLIFDDIKKNTNLKTDGFEGRFKLDEDINIKSKNTDHWYYVKRQILFDNNGDFNGLSTILIDITNRKLLNLSLADSEHRLRMISQNINGMIFRMSLPYGNYEYVSPGSARLLGYSPQDFYTTPNLINSIIHQESKDDYEQTWSKIISGEILSEEIEYKIITKSDEPKWLLQKNTFLFDHFGVLSSIEAMVTDVTEKIKSEKLLRLSEERWRILFKNAPDFIMIVNSSGIIEFLNHVDEGYSLDDFIGLNVLDIINPNDREEYQKNIELVVIEKEIQQFYSSYIDPSNKTFWYNNRLSPVIFDDKVDKIIIFASDITSERKVQEKLAQSQAQFAAITNALPDIIFILDENARYIDIFCNKNDLLYAEIPSLLGKTLTSALPPDVADKTTKSVQNTIKTKENHFIEYQLDVIAGAKWFEGHTAYLEYHGRGCCIFVARDITQRKFTELELKNSEQRYRNIFENAPIGIYRSKPDGELVFANPYLINMLEYDKLEDMQASMKTVDSYANREDRNEFKKIIETYGMIQGYEVKWLTRSGKNLLINEHSRLVTDLKSGEKFYDGIIENVTEKRIHEIAMEESERKFRSIFENAPIGIFRATPDGRFVECNTAFINMLGYDNFEEIIESEWTIAKQFFIDETSMLSQIAITLENKKLSIFENVYKRKDGSIFSGILRIKPVFDETNDLIFIEGLVEDITIRKLSEEKIKKLNQDLEYQVNERTKQLQLANEKLETSLSCEKELNVMKSRFISMISHEYRTPLTIILSSSNLIKKYSVDGNIDKIDLHLDKIQGSVNILTYLLEDVITFAQSEEDSIDLKIENFDLPMTINSFVEEISIIDNFKHRIEMVQPEEAIFVNTDKKLLRFILINLLSNACKYSHPSKKVVITIENLGNQLSISVTDQGTGISKKDLPNIFTPFYRNKDNIGSVTGHGLGLAIVKKYITALGGEVEVETELFKGSTFTITLPKQPGLFIEG
jgi:PAS domain S-box-containing protein